MPGHKLSLVRIGSLCGLVLLVGACSSTPSDPTAAWTPERIYSEAKDQLNSGGYEKAVPLLEKLEGRAAGTPLAQQAQLDKAYAQYKNGDAVLAVATLDRFMKLHPASPALDYALYLKGLANFHEDLGLFGNLAQIDLSERDQKAAKDSFEAFKELVSRFPASRYAGDAASRMRYIVNSVAQSEVNVARYYYQRGAYVAAINRAQAAVKEYDGVPALEEALYILVQCYDALNMPQMRDDTRRVLSQTFPKSAYLSPDQAPRATPWWKIW